MQQSIGIKRFVVAHVGATALAACVLVSSALGVAGLGVTGNLPWLQGGEARLAVSRPADSNSNATQANYADLMARFFDAKMERQDASEQQTAALAARAAQQETLRRFYAHKEEQLFVAP